MSQWQPIETAPMDGTVVLLFYNNRMHVGEFSVSEHYINGKRTSRSEDWYIPGYICVVGAGKIQPTHWMPLPEPPK